MQKEIILFDLDGTLTNPKLGITKSVAYALRKFGITVNNLDTLTPFIGPPLKHSFMEQYGFGETQAEDAIEYYREYFGATGLYENERYPGIKPLLASLQAQGRTLLVATSKPTVYAEQILKHFNLHEFFAHTCGSELDGSRTDKGEVIAYAMETLCNPDRSTAVMVGDRSHDIIGANKNNITSIGVLYGYGTLDELNGAGANHIAHDVAALSHLLLVQL